MGNHKVEYLHAPMWAVLSFMGHLRHQEGTLTDPSPSSEWIRSSLGSYASGNELWLLCSSSHRKALVDD